VSQLLMTLVTSCDFSGSFQRFHTGCPDCLILLHAKMC